MINKVSDQAKKGHYSNDPAAQLSPTVQLSLPYLPSDVGCPPLVFLLVQLAS